jgi:hypothetical protein
MDEPEPRPMPLRHALKVLHDYAPAMILSLVAIMVGYSIIAVTIYALSPERVFHVQSFRLDFEGANRGEYPNGTKFSAAEITNTPVIQQVYKDNHVSQFASLPAFTESIFVVESNRAYEALMREYQTRLADAKLTPIDRDRIEREFQAKRATLDKADYSVVFVRSRETDRIPLTVVKKSLNDVLATWARQAAVEKHVLQYRVPVLTTAILDRSIFDRADYIVALAILRNKVAAILANIDAIARIPGVELVRTRREQMSLAEVRLELEDIIRYRIEPTIVAARSSGMVKDQAGSLRMLEAQLAYDQRELATAKARENALRDSLTAYLTGDAKTEDARAASTTTRPAAAAGSGSDAVMPQLSEGFLDRLVDMNNRGADREYRQRMVEEIKRASLAGVPLDAAVAYDQQILDDFKKSATGASTPESAARLQEQWNQSYDAVVRALGHLKEIYNEASRQLNPVTELYSTSGPVVTRTERAFPPVRIALYGLLLLLISLPLVLGFAILHSRVREEDEQMPPVEHEVVTA